jgi:hypothetical protein
MSEYFFTSSFDVKREHNILDVPDPEPSSSHAPRRETKRKRQEREKEEEEKEKALLAVVGYECKLFRDDETAAAVNGGRFLVPWMGDESLMIDRYDVRALLDDRKLFKKTKGKQRTITKEELEEEAALDHERYFDLEHYEEELEKGNSPSLHPLTLISLPTTTITQFFTLSFHRPVADSMDTVAESVDSQVTFTIMSHTQCFIVLLIFLRSFDFIN